MADITLAELASLGLRSQALSGISDADQQAACDAASGKARSYLRSRYPTAGAITDVSYKEAVASIAVYSLLSVRGFDPQGNGADANVQLRYDAAIRWLRDVANEVAHLDIAENDATSWPSVIGGGVFSDPPRGW